MKISTRIMTTFRMKRTAWCLLAPCVLMLIQACSVQQPLSGRNSLQNMIEEDPVLKKAWVGVSIFDEDRDQYVFDYNSDKRFVPASNTKILTTYASLKYLPDSIPGWYWQETADSLYLYPNGDPTFFHRDFKDQPLIDLLVRIQKPTVVVMEENPGFSRFGLGWPWDYFQSTSVPERSQMPLYGNFARLHVVDGAFHMVPGYFTDGLTVATNQSGQGFTLSRAEYDNAFRVSSGGNTRARPFTQHSDKFLAFHLLRDTLQKTHPEIQLTLNVDKPRPNIKETPGLRTLYSAEKDTVLGVMMKRSDNFIAEQLLLMVGNELTGSLSDRRASRHILQNDLADLPDNPGWADGSGLSRNNQFSPRFYIGLLRKMETEFGGDRVRAIFPHGNEGTLRGYYEGLENQLFAKTGTLSGTIALSGYLETNSGKNLVFSFLVNQHQSGSVDVRRAVEKLLRTVVERY